MNLPVPRAVEGADLSRHVLGKGGAEPGAAYLQGMGTTAAWKDGNEWRALRDRRFTSAVYRRDGRELLFDNLKDPYQMKNLAEDRSQGSRLAHYRRQLRNWMKERNDAFEACTWYRDHWTPRRNVTGTATGVTQDVAAVERLVQKYFPAPA